MTTPASSAPAGYAFRHEILPGDREAVRAIVESTGFFSPAEVEVADELVRERLGAGPASGYFFVFLERDGQVLAYGCYGPIAATQGSFDLYWLAVHKAFQGQGLGRAVLVECEGRIGSEGGRRVYIETSGRPQYAPTRAFYERCGYVREATLKDFYGPGDDKAIYVKAI